MCFKLKPLAQSPDRRWKQTVFAVQDGTPQPETGGQVAVNQRAKVVRVQDARAEL